MRIITILTLMLLSMMGAVRAAGLDDTVVHNMIPGEPRPVVIFLHGGNSSGAIMDAYVNANADLAMKNVATIYPTGVKGFWNDGLNVTPRNDVNFLDTMIDYYVAKRMVDPSRLYIAGISNGGLMVQRMLCASRYNFAGAAVVGATHPGLNRCAKGKKTPIMFFYGSKDAFFPPDGMVGNTWFDKMKPASRNDTIAFWARVNGCVKKPLATEQPGSNPQLSVMVRFYSDCQMPVVVYDLLGAGHVWPGAKSTPAAEVSLGPNPPGFNLNQILIKSWFGR